MNGEKEILDLRDLAELLDVSKQYLYMNKDFLNEIPHFRVGSQYRFIRKDVIEWLKKKAEKGINISKIGKKQGKRQKKY